MKKYIAINPIGDCGDIQISSRNSVNGKRTISDMQSFSEWMFDWTIDIGDYTDWRDSYDYNDAITYWKKEIATKYGKKYVKEYIDSIESDVTRALSDSYRASYENERTENRWDLLRKCIEESYPNGEFKAVVNGKLVDIEWRMDLGDYWRAGLGEVEEWRLYTSKEEIAEFLSNKYRYFQDKWTIEDVKNKIKEDYGDDKYDNYVNEFFSMFDPKVINTEHIDYYGTLGNTDDWKDYLEEYEETTREIEKAIKKTIETRKKQIKSHVPLIYR